MKTVYVLVALVALLPAALAVYTPHYDALPDGATADSAEWMRKLAAKLGQYNPALASPPLNKWLFPGTHDAGAIEGLQVDGSGNGAQAWSHAQKKTIREQAYMGVRLMDLRFTLRHDKEWRIFHGKGLRYQTASQVFDQVRDWADYTSRPQAQGGPVGGQGCDVFFLRLKLQANNAAQTYGQNQKLFSFFRDIYTHLHHHLSRSAQGVSHRNRDPCTIRHRVIPLIAGEAAFEQLLATTGHQSVAPTPAAGTWQSAGGLHGGNGAAFTITKHARVYHVTLKPLAGEDTQWEFNLYREGPLFAGGAAERNNIKRVMRTQNDNCANALAQHPNRIGKFYSTVTFMTGDAGNHLSVWDNNKGMMRLVGPAMCQALQTKDAAGLRDTLKKDAAPYNVGGAKSSLQGGIKETSKAFGARVADLLPGYLHCLVHRAGVQMLDFYGIENSDKIALFMAAGVTTIRAKAIAAGGNYDAQFPAPTWQPDFSGPALGFASKSFRPPQCMAGWRYGK